MSTQGASPGSETPRVVITGAGGFLGWHTACLARTRGVLPTRVDRAAHGDPQRLAAAIADVDVIVHLAGVNRAPTDDEVEQGNVAIAEALIAALRAAPERPRTIVYSNSTQSQQDNPYGRGKARAGELLAAAAADTGARLVQVVLPGLFGEHGRPAYNSFVATFADAVARGGGPQRVDDRPVPLLYVGDAARVLLGAPDQPDDLLAPAGEARGVAEVLELLRGFHATYAETAQIPCRADRFEAMLFNTYRSYLPVEARPIPAFTDARGTLLETVRSECGPAQTYASTTLPGQRRGEHYHLEKVERFTVIAGEAEIQLRRLLHDDVVTLRVSGREPALVDMPTLWVHNLVNVGDRELVTVFYADQLLDRDNPDQFPELVGWGESPPSAEGMPPQRG